MDRLEAELREDITSGAVALSHLQSEFTHPGGGGTLTKRRGRTTGLWKSLPG